MVSKYFVDLFKFRGKDMFIRVLDNRLLEVCFLFVSLLKLSLGVRQQVITTCSEVRILRWVLVVVDVFNFVTN